MTDYSKITALYSRLSVGDEDRDGGESNSIQNQKIFLENYARGQHLTNIRHYIDDDESGRFFDRSAYSRMMDDVENGKIGVCIMKDLTRWGRDYLQVGNAMEIFRRNNVRFIAVNNGIDSEKPDTLEFAPFINIMSEWYAKDISKKVKTGIKTKGMSGKPIVTEAPYGYVKDPDNKDFWVIDEEAAEVVRLIFRLFIGGKNRNQIAVYLTQEQIPTPTFYMKDQGRGTCKNKTLNEDNRCKWNKATLTNKELHQLVYGEMAKKQRTGNPYVSFVSFAIGTVILLVAYWIVVEHFMAASGAMLLIAVLLGIIGTILFIRGLARILSIWAASIKHKATRGLYVFTLRQLHENVVNKYISISVASILMMLTIMLITDGSVRIMSYGSELTRGTSVYDFTVMGNDQIVEKYLSNEQIRPYVSNLNRMEIGNIKSTASDGISSPVDWSKFRKQIVQHLPQDVVDPATQEDGMYSFGSDQPAALNLLGLIDTGSSSPYLLPVSSYNRLLDAAGEKQISLGNNEVVYYLNPDFLGNAQDETVTLLNQIAADAQANNEALLSINERPFYLVPSVPMKGLTADENIKIITALIVSDEIYSEFVNSDTCMVYWNFCIPNELVETKGLMLPIMEARDLLKPSGLYYESYLNNFGRQLFYVISGSYTTLYMGFMFLIIACALLALQFLTQMQTTKSRYLTLSILGARREQIKRSINQQVLWYFLLPLILACISGAVGIYAMQLYLYSGAAHLEQSYPLLIAMAVIVVLVMVIYGVAVARTANREIGKLNYKPNS